ncbi:osmotically inducible protein OsmC [Tissierella creatinini]|nr:osmotically inducible protein OsmC [Tissierella creatinini]TJX66159.1 osmotically inducible protein OsmC [Soehngenia saccharolytica]
MSYLNVEFPGGLRVDARLRDQVIKTDQPVVAGGEGSAPSPFELFLGSIATCAGIYALGFCNSKGISTEGMSISMDLERNMSTGLISKVNLDLKLPEGFPEKYKSAIVNSMDLCTVKKHLQTPPKFEITTK